MWWLSPSGQGSLLSWVLGLVDQTCSILLRLLGDRRPKFFGLGWGDSHTKAMRSKDLFLDKTQAYQQAKRLDDSSPFYDISDSIQWERPSVPSGAIVMTKGQFPSPIAEDLPPIAKMCQFHLVEPREKKTSTKDLDNDAKTLHSSPKNNVVVIMLPATGEASKRARLSMARKLARDHGWSSVIVTAPFYGARKPSDQSLFFINTVNDFLNQSLAIMEEAAALASYYLEKSPDSRVCITGFSWGAAMTCCATSVALLAGCDGRRLACVPYVGSGTPAVLPDGILQRTIDWKAISRPDESFTSIQSRLLKHFEEFEISVFTNLVDESRQNASSPDHKERLSLGALKVVSMHHDHIIRRSWAESLVSELHKLTTSSTTVFPTQWLPGGHVLAAVLKHRFQTSAIVEAVSGLEK